MKDAVLRGDYQLLYITPELLIGSNVCRKMLTGEVYEQRLKAFVVDEAHTVKKWYANTAIILLLSILQLFYAMQGADFSQSNGEIGRNQKFVAT